MTPPTISVLMPVYNADRYLAVAVESILSQSFADFEFLIVNDGSTDSSLEQLQEFAKRDARIRLIDRPNTGYLIALNEMLERATGEFIARMDADDISDPVRFERQIEFLRRHPECVAVGSRVILIDADGDPLCPFRSVCEHEAIDRQHLTGRGGAIVHPTVMVRRDDLLAVGGYRAEYYPAEDTDLFLRLAERGQLANLPEALLKYRRHLESTGHLHHTKQVDAIRRAVQDAALRRGIDIAASLEPSATRSLSAAEQHRMWAWWALGAGHVNTARKHARTAMKEEPLALASWKVTYSAWRGR